MRASEIGDSVIITQKGATYNIYSAMATSMGLLKFESGYIPRNGMSGVVLSIRYRGTRNNHNTTFYGVRLDNGKEIIIGGHGIEPVVTNMVPEELFEL